VCRQSRRTTGRPVRRKRCRRCAYSPTEPGRTVALRRVPVPDGSSRAPKSMARVDADASYGATNQPDGNVLCCRFFDIPVAGKQSHRRSDVAAKFRLKKIDYCDARTADWCDRCDGARPARVQKKFARCLGSRQHGGDFGVTNNGQGPCSLPYLLDGSSQVAVIGKVCAEVICGLGVTRRSL